MSSDERDGSAFAGTHCAYLILSHKNPSQVEHLTRRILQLSPAAHVVIHHDLTGGPAPWSEGPPAQVHLVDPTSVQWGAWSIVDASLRTIRYALEELRSPWMVLLSGEHWPVTDLAAWEVRVASSGVDAVMPAEILPQRLRFGHRHPDANRDLARCRLRWFDVRPPRTAAMRKAVAALAKISALTHPLFKLEYSMRNESWFVGVPRRRGALKQWDLYKGSEWFAMNAKSARVLLEADPEVSTWFRRSHIPDESYFQSVLHHDDQLVIDGSIVTWVPPQPSTPTPGWFLLKEKDLPVAAASAAAFARKVDPDRNPDVMAAIDATLEAGRPFVRAGQ